MKLVVATVIATVVAAPAPAMAQGWDLAGVQTLDKGLASPVADDVSTFLTNPFVTGGAVGLVALGANAKAYQTAVTGLAAEVVGVGLAEGLKALTDRPRPYLVDPTLRTPAGKETDSSFPSGHSTVAFAAAAVVALDQPSLAPYGYAFATLVGLSRVYEGVHYPTDVLAGAALGTLTGVGAIALRNYLQGRHWLWAPAADLPARGPALALDGGNLALAWHF
ncbi:MAG: phosphatase PAP2 family protein [Cyanobacteria bacterium REEB65]|nr:phosphatase PAP2 family protein [Cyanobacteria bacterium REEB65]